MSARSCSAVVFFGGGTRRTIASSVSSMPMPTLADTCAGAGRGGGGRARLLLYWPCLRLQRPRAAHERRGAQAAACAHPLGAPQPRAPPTPPAPHPEDVGAVEADDGLDLLNHALRLGAWRGVATRVHGGQREGDRARAARRHACSPDAAHGCYKQDSQDSQDSHPAGRSCSGRG